VCHPRGLDSGAGFRFGVKLAADATLQQNHFSCSSDPAVVTIMQGHTCVSKRVVRVLMSCVYCLEYMRNNLIERNHSSRGGFLFTMFPDQETGGRGPPMKKHPQK